MYLVLDKKAPWRYTRGPFVFLDGLKSRLTHLVYDGNSKRGYYAGVLSVKVSRASGIPGNHRDNTRNNRIPIESIP